MIYSYEKIKNIFISLEPFAVENGLLTPTLKMKRSNIFERLLKNFDCLLTYCFRREVAKVYKAEIDKLYPESGTVASKAMGKL